MPDSGMDEDEENEIISLQIFILFGFHCLLYFHVTCPHVLQIHETSVYHT